MNMSKMNKLPDEYNWPPTKEQIQNVAISALKQSNQKNINVLVYWKTNPNYLIFDPVNYANTKYITIGYESKDKRIVTVQIGEANN